MSAEQRYLYRFDSLEALRRQRISDPVLRGRRSYGDESTFSHQQVRTEMATIKEGEGVYRLSFWKTWDCLHLNLWSHHNGHAVQRISENHPVLAAFKRDHDEYIENYAWLYWNAMHVDTANPNWSPVGIPHADIEVLHPDGRWLPMDKMPCLSDTPVDGWKTYYIHGHSSNSTPIHTAATGSNENGVTWLMFRQPASPWMNVFGAQRILSQLVTAVASDAGIRPEAARWILAVEHADRVRAYEFYPRFFQPRESGLRGLINRLCGQEPPQEIVVDDDKRHLPEAEIETLYEAFGIPEHLRRGERWSYKHLLLPLEETQALRAELAKA